MWVIGQSFINVGYVIGLLARHRYPAAAHLCGWNIFGYNAFDDRHDGKWRPGTNPRPSPRCEPAATTG